MTISNMLAQTVGHIDGTIRCLEFGLITRDEALRDIKMILEKYNLDSSEYLASFGKHTIGAMN